MKVAYLALAGALAALGSNASVYAAGGDTYMNGASLYGAPAPEGSATRTTSVDKAMKQVNIVCGDIVTFTSGGKNFTWKFDVASHRPVPLAKIAPSGFDAGALTVYVSRNSMERR